MADFQNSLGVTLRMETAVSRFAVGDDWVYRARVDAASLRVRILAVHPKKRSAQVEVAFVDDPVGRVETVPGFRLRAPWSEVETYDALMDNWRRVNNGNLDDVEEACAEEVFCMLIPTDIAGIEWSPVSCATAIYDTARLALVIGVQVDELLADIECFDLDGTVMVSPAGTLLLAEAACRANTQQVLDMVMEQETQARHKCMHGAERDNALTREKQKTSPEWEYAQYQRWDRPRHELFRQWCGHRAVTFYERLLAAEAENHRLDVLVAELVKALDDAGDKIRAVRFAEEHERDRITPHTVRPTVERPLDPWEIPVREVSVRRRWPR